ncbi:condensation domain-containing protein [Actinocrispum wychmicini]|uniref:Condensation domain-containing protein n=1 Tax=Actinocrispum wychmicini TaxID=1213861 RepID=A0A4R2JX67_9PSEU|nr:condensation domain-containing protein [Actinocrispum wychmicini]TCO61926.1 condensation domain-containing protein [Actinocrispum wychmicini]
MDTQTYPLTFGQEHHLTGVGRPSNGHSTSLHLVYRIIGPLSVGGVVSALRAVVRRNDCLRVALVLSGDGGLRQRLLPQPEDSRIVAAAAVQARSEEQFDRYVENMLTADLMSEADLVGDYPFRFRLFRYSADLHALFGVFQHVAVDDRARGLIASEIWQRYDGRIDPEEMTIESARLTFLDAVTNQRSRFEQRNGSAVREYWRDKIAGAPPVTQVWPSSKAQSTGSIHSLSLTGEALSGWRAECADMNLSEFQRAVAVFVAAILEVSPQDRLVVHVPIDQRTAADREVAGMFAVSLPLVINRADDLRSLSAQVQGELFKTMSRSHVPAGDLRTEYEKLSNGWSFPATRTVFANHFEHATDTRRLAPGELEIDSRYYLSRASTRAVGIELMVHTYSSRIEFVVGLVDSYFAPPDSDDFFARFTELLSSPSETLVRSVERHGLAEIRDSAGRVVMCADLHAMSEVVESHPAVRSTTVSLEHRENERDVLHAEVEATVSLSIDEIRDYCTSAAEPAEFVLVPNTFRVTVA